MQVGRLLSGVPSLSQTITYTTPACLMESTPPYRQHTLEYRQLWAMTGTSYRLGHPKDISTAVDRGQLVDISWMSAATKRSQRSFDTLMPALAHTHPCNLKARPCSVFKCVTLVLESPKFCRPLKCFMKTIQPQLNQTPRNVQGHWIRFRETILKHLQ
mgnify:CR=1 FL=1